MNLFDILGPVMVGPSSSHTAGAVRIGLITRKLLGRPPVRAELLLHGSFAATGKGHGTDPVSYTHLDVYKRQAVGLLQGVHSGRQPLSPGVRQGVCLGDGKG